MHRGGYGKFIIAHILAAATIGLISAATVSYRRRKPKASSGERNQPLVPRLHNTESGLVGRLERFSDYVARQIGFKDGSECPELSKLVYEYIKGSKGCDNRIYEYFADEPNADVLYVKLVEEFDTCILSYFAFHWSRASLMVTQILSVDSDNKQLKNMVLAATRKGESSWDESGNGVIGPRESYYNSLRNIVK